MKGIKTKDYTAIVTVLKTKFKYAYAFKSENDTQAKKFANWKFDNKTTKVSIKKGEFTIENGKVIKIK